MQVFELHYPGTWYDAPVPEDTTELTALLTILESHLADAAVALWFFQQALASGPCTLRVTGHIEEISDAMGTLEFREAADTLQRDWMAGNLTAAQLSKARADLIEDASLRARRQQWSDGRAPDGYLRRLPHIYAHTVLYALDGIQKTLCALADISELPNGVSTAYHAYVAAVPGLTPVRNSAHHTEDRARRIGHGNHPIILQPGDGIVIGNLNENKLGYTGSDGHHYEIEIGAATIKAAQAAIQQAINAIPWRGPARIIPR